ncbi:hypothetical protein [Candidatus Nitrosocosmicus hydrocola]|uniref:hypothetical protein n=1 Tax=Candidatus Nitrosocosmicus hydrocola TaxID=1826872 RepID=UPI0011E5AF75|nr:hypothetical protein [Candidatus Nitrosocosmicus hydrocola]
MHTTHLIFSFLIAVSIVALTQEIEGLELNNPIDLMNPNQTNWSKTENARLYFLEKRLDNFTVQTNENETSYSRITASMHLGTLDSPPYIYLNYATNSSAGNPMFIVEIRKTMPADTYALGLSSNGGNYQKYLWSENMGNTLGYFTTRILPLPIDVNNSEIELRFYIISQIPTDAYVKFSNSTIFNL